MGFFWGCQHVFKRAASWLLKYGSRDRGPGFSTLVDWGHSRLMEIIEQTVRHLSVSGLLASCQVQCLAPCFLSPGTGPTKTAVLQCMDAAARLNRRNFGLPGFFDKPVQGGMKRGQLAPQFGVLGLRSNNYILGDSISLVSKRILACICLPGAMPLEALPTRLATAQFRHIVASRKLWGRRMFTKWPCFLASQDGNVALSFLPIIWLFAVNADGYSLKRCG